MLRKNFPTSDLGAKQYGGYLSNSCLFVRLFEVKENIHDTFDDINNFLKENKYGQIDIKDVVDGEYDNFPVSIGATWIDDKIALYIHRDAVSCSSYESIINRLIKFRDERDWAQFHNAKDLAVALNIESAELLENFLWKDPEEADKDKVKEELADVFAYAFLLANKYDFNVEEIVLEKMQKNAEKYPIDKAKGNAKKYNEFNQ